MEQTVYNGTVHQHMGGAGFQSQYVPAEKPYAVYGFVKNGLFMAAQQIGTIISMKSTDEGVEYESSAVWRSLTQPRREDRDAFVVKGVESEIMFIGLQGERVGYDILLDQLENGRCIDESLNPNEYVKEICDAGVDIDVSEEIKQRNFTDQKGRIEYSPRYYGRDYQKKEDRFFLHVKGNVVMWVRIDYPLPDVLSDMDNTLRLWRRMGMGEFSIDMGGNELEQKMIDELLVVTDIYHGIEEECRRVDGRFGLWRIIEVCQKLGVKKCMLDDLLVAMRSTDDGYVVDDAEELSKQMLTVGIAERRGNIIEFSDDFYRMLSWKFVKTVETDDE